RSTAWLSHPCRWRPLGSLARRDDAVVVQVDMSKLPVGVLPRQGDWPAGLGSAAADLGDFIFEAADQVDPGTVLVAGHRIANGLALHIDQTVDANVSLPRVDVDRDVDRLEHRIEHLLHRGGKDVPDRGEGLGLLSGEDGEQGLALTLVGPLVDDHESLAAALVDRSGPLHHGDGSQPVQLHVGEMPFLDGEAADGLAAAVRRQRVELASATIGAVAVDELVGLNFPGYHDGASSVGASMRPLLSIRIPGWAAKRGTSGNTLGTCTDRRSGACPGQGTHRRGRVSLALSQILATAAMAVIQLHARPDYPAVTAASTA